MGDMRPVILGLIVSISVLVPAFAAQGYRAKITTTIELSDTFFKAADPYGHSGFDPGAFTIPPVTGMLYLGDNRLRVDMNAPMGTMSSLFDGKDSYMLDMNRQVAWKMPKPQGGPADLPLFNLDQLASHWGRVSQQLGNIKGLTTKQLGKKKLGGLSCTGVKFTGDIRKLLDADEVQVAPGMPPLSNLKGNWTGTFWTSDRAGLPMRITSSFSGISLTWELSDVKSAEVPDAMLKLPPGFKVKQMDDQSAAGAS
jgi:hypothetical protein